MRRALLTLIVVLLLPGTAVAAPPAEVVLSGPGARPANEPAVDVDAERRTVVAWTQVGRGRSGLDLVVRRGVADGPFGAPRRVARRAFSPSVAAGPDGGAAVLWEHIAPRGGVRRLKVAVARGAGQFGAPQTLLTVRANVTDYRVLPIAGGRYLAIWWQGDPRTGRHPVRYAISSGDAMRFGAVQTLTADTGPLSGVSAAVAPDGSVLAGWGTPLTRTRNQQAARAVLAPGASRFGPAQRIEAVHADEGAETVDIDTVGGPGGTALTWFEAGRLPALLRAAFGAPDAAPVTLVELDSRDLGRASAEGPELALPASGEPLTVWALIGGPGGESEEITEGRVFAAGRQVSTPGTVATQAQAVASATQAVVTWTTGDYPRYASRFVVRDPEGRFTSVEPIARARTPRAPVLAASRAAVVAAWTTRGRRPVVALAVLARD
jgi:hypothetical protein